LFYDYFWQDKKKLFISVFSVSVKNTGSCEGRLASKPPSPNHDPGLSTDNKQHPRCSKYSTSRVDGCSKDCKRKKEKLRYEINRKVSTLKQQLEQQRKKVRFYKKRFQRLMTQNK
jgi:hypothetical protein